MLLAARNLSAARARRWAIGLVVVACALWMVLGLLQGLGGEWVGTAHGEGQAKLAAFSAGALQTLQFHSREVWATVPALWLLQGPSALAMFLFGMQCLEEGLRQLAGSGLERLIPASVDNP